MAIFSNTVNYLDGDTLLQAFFAYDDAIDERKPAVLIAHTWGGRDEFVNNKAKQLAKLGYVAFALDMYGQGILGTSPEENAALMQPFIDDRQKLQQRINAALYAVRLLPWVDDSKVAAIGFCFGGLCVLDLARMGADLKGVVSFHGLLNEPQSKTTQPVVAKVLALHGHDDPMASDALVSTFCQEMTDLQVDWQLHQYGNTVHAFTNPLANAPALGTVYKKTADTRSWQSMKNFLAEIFA
ncbi:dienelactone hydrolase family protein [Methyloprofundus sp.]|uniref:dienelactone hydrolase family protein n=1 Tax=Methyloprofundus sp. TaxID=2020875 RepID=UPI003D0EE6DC